LSEM